MDGYIIHDISVWGLENINITIVQSLLMLHILRELQPGWEHDSRQRDILGVGAWGTDNLSGNSEHYLKSQTCCFLRAEVQQTVYFLELRVPWKGKVDKLYERKFLAPLNLQWRWNSRVWKLRCCLLRLGCGNNNKKSSPAADRAVMGANEMPVKKLTEKSFCSCVQV